MAMHTARILPNVIRGVVGGSSELVSAVKHYNSPNVIQNSPVCLLSNCPEQWRHTRGYSTIPIYTPISQKCLLTQEPSLWSAITANNFSISVSQSENDHAHDIMRSLPAYSRSTVALDDMQQLLSPVNISECPPPVPGIDWSVIHPQAIVSSFVHLSVESKNRNMELSSPSFKPLVSSLVNNVQNLTVNQIKELFAALSLWENLDNPTTTNFNELWNALDGECVQRARRGLSLEDTLIISDLFYALKLSRICAFTRVVLNILAHRTEDMAPHHLVHYGFLMNLAREPAHNVSHLKYERALLKAMDQLTLEELGVIAMGLFKSRSFIQSDDVCSAFLNRLMASDMSRVSHISIAAFFKLLRKSIKATHIDKLYKLLQSVSPIISQVSLLGQLQIALVGSDTLVFHPKVINEIALNFAANCSSLRLKDIERIVLVLMMFNYIPPNKPDIFHTFAEEIRKPNRIAEANIYPKSFISCVTYMATMGHMAQDLISTALQPSLVSHVDSNSNYSDLGREVLELDNIIEIELPDYNGNRLKKKQKEDFSKKYWSRHRLPQDVNTKDRNGLTHQERLTLDVSEKIGSLVGCNDAVTVVFVLPHCPTPVVLLCTNEDGEPVPIPAEYKSLHKYSIKHPINGLKFTAVLVGGRNYYIRGTDRVRGQIQMMTRQLTKLGYSVTIVPFMHYGKKSVKRKLGLLNDILTRSNALKPDEARADIALLSMKASNVLSLDLSI